MRIKIAFICFFLMTSNFACDQSETASTSSAKPIHEEICYRCGGHKFEVDDTTPTLVHDGTMYYFCAEVCKTEFAKNPAKYLPKKEG
jgi:YHS domain-containing protein